MVAWLWNSRKSLRAATARPTVILPTAGGPKITSRRMGDIVTQCGARTSTRFP